MGIKRIVDVQFWNDDKVLEYFSPEDKLFMLYLMTNPHTTQLGIYPINKKHMSFELGYTIDVINVLIDRFENKYGMIKYSNETKEIAIKNYLRHSIIKGGAPVRDCLVKEIKNVKNKELLVYVFSNLKEYEINDTVTKIISEYEEKNGELLYCNENKNDNEKENDNDNDNENENDNDNEVSYHDTLNDTCRVVIERLNELTGSNYKYKSDTNKELIKARLNEGYTKDDLILVVEKMCYLWNKEPKKGEKDTREWLRPSTLFRKSKFGNYLGMKVQQRQLTTKDLIEAGLVDFSKFRD